MTNSELILLSLLAECPRHGYELEHVIEERGMRNWTEIAFSSIYFLLNKLVRDGLATFSTQPAQGRGPAKKVYKATKAGRLALKQGVRAGLANPQPGSRDFMFALSCLPLLASELQQHPALTQPGFPPHVKAMFTYSLPLLQAELEWLEQLILEIQNGVFQNGKN